MIPDFLHQFFFFLGTMQGNFFTVSIELVLVTFLAYMVISEYLRSREPELRFLILAFLGFMVQRFLLAAGLGLELFAGVSLYAIEPFIPLAVRTIESFSLLFLAAAFVHPIFKARRMNINKFLGMAMAALAATIFLVEGWWLFTLHSSPVPFSSFTASGVFVLCNIIILLIPIAFWLLLPVTKKEMHIGFAYRRGTLQAFSIYLIAPSIELINHVFFANASDRLLLAQQPFPIISVLLVARMVYLRLVDKVSLRERLEQTERRYLAEKEVGRMKDEFVSVVSHELRTPLTSMKLYLALLLEGKLGRISAQQKDAIKTVKKESDRLSLLIDDILSLSKLEAKKSRLDIKKHDLHSLLDTKLYDSLAQEKGIAVINRVPKSFTVAVDAPKFQQLFVNLFSNAVKFTPEGGKVTLEAKKNASSWDFSVQDTGIGIPKEKVPKLFDKFYQLDSSITRTKGGTGLGLAIVKQIVDLHHGKILVDSQQGKGSTFTVRMPNQI